MARFVLVDPWLAGVGGHNFQYARDILQAAAAMGYETLLAANDRYAEPAPVDACHVVPAFRFESCSRYWLGPDGKSRHPVSLDGELLDEATPTGPCGGLSRRLARLLDARRADRRRRIMRYAADCGDFFEEIGFRSDDIVFFPSLSEFDFLGVARFLETTPGTGSLDWHLQFHFDIFDGREHEYLQQSRRLNRFRTQFRAALDRIPQHRLHFYGTTERIAAQYERMQVARFQPLPYCVSRLAPPTGRVQPGPLRLTCAGVVRREKGRVALREMISELREPWLESGRMQLVIQADRKALRRILPRDMARRFEILDGPEPTCDWPVVPVAYPLGAEAYTQLIAQADIGLFLYDPRRYFARCSGVLVEMLAAGIPVVVPAGCWLADQLASPNFKYLDGLARNAARFEASGCTADIGLPADSRGAIIQLQAADTEADREYLEVRTDLFAGDGRRVASRSAILSPVFDHHPPATLVPIPSAARRMHINLKTAYGDRPVPASLSQIAFLSAGDDGARLPPRGAVGLTAASSGEVAELLDEVARHYEHYRRTACGHAAQRRFDHAAGRTVEFLLDNCRRDLDRRAG